jgi:hypothetical protein
MDINDLRSAGDRVSLVLFVALVILDLEPAPQGRPSLTPPICPLRKTGRHRNPRREVVSDFVSNGWAIFVAGITP